MKKIGIITFHRCDNYGAVLQNMALVSTIKTMNSELEVQTIDYRNEYLEAPYNEGIICYNSGIIRNIYRTLRNLRYLSKTKKRRKVFNDFRKEYLNLSESFTKADLNKAEKIYDVYISGSDQVWNSKIVGEIEDNIFSLGFVKNSLKISYAASAGNSSKISMKTLKYLKDLDTISVRESELGDFLSKKLERKVRIDIDPVFLLNMNNWNECLSKRRIVNEKYIFVYCIGDKSKEVSKIAQDYAKKKNLKIVYVNFEEHYGVNGRCLYGASPMEFVQLIRDSEMVIASSFHATAFSVLFHKNIIAVPCSGTGGRITELLSTLSLENQVVSSYNNYINKEFKSIDYNKVDNILMQLREESIAYLNNGLMQKK